MQAIIAASQGVPYRMCLTATPCPNDYAEILNQAAFLGIATRDYLLATYFRTLLTGKVVLRKHAAVSFVRCALSPSLLNTQCVVKNETRPSLGGSPRGPFGSPLHAMWGSTPRRRTTSYRCAPGSKHHIRYRRMHSMWVFRRNLRSST